MRNLQSYFRAMLVTILPALLILAACSQQPTAVQSESSAQATVTSVQKIADNECVKGQTEAGAYYLICMPDDWNGDLVMFAHGYVSPTEPVELQEDQLYTSDGSYIPDIITDMGYAFATTSYRANGLVVQEAIMDLEDLVNIFDELYGQPQHNYLVGGSEGGLITTKSVESKDLYSGGLAACGPIGDFIAQINYMGDFRVLFDFYFPDVLPPSPISIPQEVMDHWDDVYVPKIIQAITDYPDRTLQLLRVARAPFDPDDPETIGQTVLGLLWYNVFATNDLNQRAGGNPFDNHDRNYFGSDNDAYLNKNVERFIADPQAVEAVNQKFQTTGIPSVPLIAMHTAGDPIVPFWHERMYRSKVAENGNIFFYHNYPIVRYGHCTFTEEEILQAFTALVLQVQALEKSKELPEPPVHPPITRAGVYSASN